MGACYSSNDSNKIKASAYNRQKKSTGCLGPICCESDKNNTSIRNPIQIVNIPNIRSSYNIYYKNGEINNYIEKLISNNQSPIPLQKINFIQLYNIFMNFAYDFTRSNFIVCDTRQAIEDKNQIFLKKFSQINFTPQQVESMQENRMNKFKNYLKNKNIIFILKDEITFEILEEFITIFSTNYDFNLKNIYILTESFQKSEEEQINNTIMENLFLFIDEDALYEYTPKILINSADIKSSNLNYENNLSHNALTFITTYPHIVNSKQAKKNKIINKLDINNICDEDLEENNIFLNFFSKFKIECILNFISEVKSGNENNNNNLGLITHSEAKRKKINGEEHRITIKQKNISIPKNTVDFTQFYNLIQGDFNAIIEEFKFQFVNNNCIIIEFDDEINENIKMKLLFIIVNKITGLYFEDIENYLKNNFFILEGLNVWPNKEEMINFLK